MIRSKLFNKILSKNKEMVSFSTKLDRYIWMDLEMTGLDIKKHKILEIACIITSTDLKPIHEGINLIIHQPEDVLNSMNEWSAIHHNKTGLIQTSRESKISITEADQLVSQYIKNHSKDKGIRYLAGNSVHQDRIFIDKYMPYTSSLLHYRILDVSTIKILCGHWYFNEYSKIPKKKSAHRALDDILDSIDELKNYQEMIFKPQSTGESCECESSGQVNKETF